MCRDTEQGTRSITEQNHPVPVPGARNKPGGQVADGLGWTARNVNLLETTTSAAHNSREGDKSAVGRPKRQEGVGALRKSDLP